MKKIYAKVPKAKIKEVQKILDLLDKLALYMGIRLVFENCDITFNKQKELIIKGIK